MDFQVVIYPKRVKRDSMKFYQKGGNWVYSGCDEMTKNDKKKWEMVHYKGKCDVILSYYGNFLP